tara:strand:+ start:370 stop:792 length:423 start_codon:yes stop_codon:yes gene_type:complete
MELQYFKIWMAGFYEGEGCICNDKSNNNRLRMDISQNDPTPLYKAQKIWGGTVRKRVRKSPASDKICTSYEWRLCHHDAITFLSDIDPYLQIPYKMQQIVTALEKAENGLDRRFKCKYCEKDYASPSGRRRHEKSVHLNN